MKARNAFLAFLLFGAVGAVTSTWLEHRALAGRNSSGTFSLYTPGNPVVTGTPVSSGWANNTLTDIGTELTNSLDRNGRGAMLQPLSLSVGTVAAPGVVFTGESNSGLYWSTIHDLRFAVGGSDALKFTNSGITIPAPAAGSSAAGLTVTGGSTNGSGIVATGTGTGIGVFGTGGPSSGPGGEFTGGASNGIGLIANGTGSGAAISAIGGSGAAIIAAGSPGISIPAGGGGITIGGGQNISGSFGANPTGTLTWTPSTTTAGANSTATSSVTGASTASTCITNVPTATNNCFVVVCTVSSTNTVSYRAFNTCATTQTPPGAMNIRVFNF